MIKSRALRNTCTILSAGLLMVSWAAGCNTTQSPARQADDLRITTEVKAKLASDVSPASLTNIEVNTTNGVISLAGQVESADVKERAERVATTVAGVVRVNNNLQVDPAAPATP